MIPMMLSILTGAAVALAVWSLRAQLAARIAGDIEWVTQTSLQLSPEPVRARRWVLGWYAIMFVVLLPAATMFPVVLIGLAAWLALWRLPRLIVSKMQQKRRAKIDGQLPAMARKLSAIVGAGVAPAEAFLRLADESPMPIRYEFQIIARTWELGSDLNTSLEEAARRLKLPSVRLFASTIILNNQMGGNLVQTLERLAASLESIAEMRQEIRAATAEGRMNIYGLMLAPFIMLALNAVMDSESVVKLLTTPMGWSFLMPAIALTTIGVLWARATVRVNI